MGGITTAFLVFVFVFAAPPADQAPGYIGIQPAPLTAELKKEHKIADDVKGGLVLLVVHEGTAADKAGLRAGDVLTSFDNKSVGSIEDLLGLLKDKRPGDKVAYSARRGTGTIAGVLVLGRRPPDVAMEEREEVVEEPMPKPDVRPVPAREAELEERAAKLRAEMDALRKRALEKRAAAAKERAASAEKRPKGFAYWIEREERALEDAEKAKSIERIIWHKGRLQLLREMRKAGAPQGRVAKLEKKLQHVLERLERLEQKLK